MATIKYISATELRQLYGAAGIVICDIREADEYNREHIVGAINAPISSFDLATMNELSHAANSLIVYCQSGTRTKLNQAKFQNLNCPEVMILRDGVSAWKKLGCALVINNKAPLPIMRQVQIVAGGLILIGVILGYLISPVCFLLSGFVGAGLLLAGVSGFCGMANLLMILPYNKNNNCNNSCNN